MTFRIIKNNPKATSNPTKGDAIKATITLIIPLVPITLGPFDPNPAATSPKIMNYEIETGIPNKVARMQVTPAPIKTPGKHKANKTGSLS